MTTNQKNALTEHPTELVTSDITTKDIRMNSMSVDAQLYHQSATTRHDLNILG